MAESKKDLAAKLAGFEADQALGFAERENGDVVILAPDGRKYVYTPAQLEKAQAPAEAVPKAEPKPSQAAKPKASTTKRAPAKKG